MQLQRTRDTAPELAVRRLLHARGLRYRVDRAPLPGMRRRADIVFGPARVAVFVDGCFWHGCPQHGNPRPAANGWYWPAKIAANQARDADTDQRLAAAGWAVVRTWEHDNPAHVADQVESLVRARRATARPSPSEHPRGAASEAAGGTVGARSYPPPKGSVRLPSAPAGPPSPTKGYPRSPKGFNSGDFNRKMRGAQRKAQCDAESAMKRAQRDAQRDAEAAAKRSNQDLERRLNKAITAGNRDAEQRARRLQRSASTPPAAFTPREQELAEQLHTSIAAQPDDRDLFLSYTRSDGSDVAAELYSTLTELGVSVWYDEVVIRPGKSQALQMDRGLTRARAGVVLLTPAFLEGRFWPERELGALLSKPTVIPVLHRVTFVEVAAYSALLQDMAGFTTEKNTPTEIAGLIAAAVLDEDAA